MRLPVKKNGSINDRQAAKDGQYAIDRGVNYGFLGGKLSESLDLRPNVRSAEIARRSIHKASPFVNTSRRSQLTSEGD